MSNILKRLLLLACALLSFLHAPAQAQRIYQSAELESLLAPIALYPDSLISEILEASLHPADVMEAAREPSPENPAWHPSVQTLLAFPDILERMAASPSWMFDLGSAYLAQAPQVMESVQVLRQRAQASGALRSNGQQQVQQYGQTISVLPAIPQVIYVPYYDPLVVYGAWRPAYRVVYWRPWPTRRVFVSNHFHGVTPYVGVPESRRHPIVQSAPPIALRGNGPPSPAARMQGVRVMPQQAPQAQQQPHHQHLHKHRHQQQERKESRTERPAHRSPPRS